MRFTANRADLAKALRLAMSASTIKGGSPILAHAALRVQPSGRLTVAGTDLIVALLADLRVTNADKGGMCAEAKRLVEIVSAMDGDEVTMHAVDTKQIEIKCGKSMSRIPATADREFPRVPATPTDWTQVDDAQGLASAFSRALPAMCREDSRTAIHGVKLERFGEVLHVSTTDGHRLHSVATAVPASKEAPPFLPERGAKEIIRLLGDESTCRIALVGEWFHVATESATLAIKTLVSSWPEWRHHPAATAEYGRERIEVDREELTLAIKRAGLMVEYDKGDAVRGIVVTFEKGSDTATIQCSSPDKGEAFEEVALARPWTHAGMEIGLHPRFLVEAVNACGGEVARIALGGPLDPLRIVSGDGSALAIMMPMDMKAWTKRAA